MFNSRLKKTLKYLTLLCFIKIHAHLALQHKYGVDLEIYDIEIIDLDFKIIS